MVVPEISHHFEIVCLDALNLGGVLFVGFFNLVLIGICLLGLLVSNGFECGGLNHLGLALLLNCSRLKCALFFVKSFNGSGVGGFPRGVEHIQFVCIH